jgi:hypothetical protein
LSADGRLEFSLERARCLRGNDLDLQSLSLAHWLVNVRFEKLTNGPEEGGVLAEEAVDMFHSLVAPAVETIHSSLVPVGLVRDRHLPRHGRMGKNDDDTLAEFMHQLRYTKRSLACILQHGLRLKLQGLSEVLNDQGSVSDAS